MHAKTMEGLAGASMNMKMMNTPFRVYEQAERRGDTATMARAMGYVGETADKAEDYQKKIEKGMKEEAKEAQEKAKSEQENAIRKRKEERGEQEKRIAESKNKNTDTVSISENGKAVAGERSDSVQAGTDSGASVEETADVIMAEPVIYTLSGGSPSAPSGACVTGCPNGYTKTGEAARPESGTNISVSA